MIPTSVVMDISTPTILGIYTRFRKLSLLHWVPWNQVMAQNAIVKGPLEVRRSDSSNSSWADEKIQAASQ
ncbi:hypothetical protein V2G26_006237 [Clonostachys chloroleuca]